MSIASAAILAINVVLLVSPKSSREASAAGDLTVAMAEDPVLDPHRGGLPGSWLVSRAVHRGLYAFPASSDGVAPVPDLAGALPAEVGDGIYELQVQAVTFSDGAPLSLDDVIASIDRLKRSGVGISRFLAPIERVRAVGTLAERRLRIVASRPMPELASILAHPQAAIVRASTPDRVSALGPPGLGPYRVDSRSLQRRLTLVRNSNWVAATDPVRAANADRIVFDIYPSGPDALADVVAGDARMIGDPGPPDVFARTASTRPGGRCTRLVAIDHRAPGLDRLSARRRVQAALLGVDLTTGGTKPAFGILPPLVTGARTQQLVVEAAGAPPARTLTLAGSSTVRDTRELNTIAERLRNAGISVSIERRAPGLHARLLRAPSATRPDLVLFSWCAEWPGLAGRTFLEPLTGAGGLAPRTDTLQQALAAARVAAPAEAAAAWARAEARLQATATLVPVGWPAEIAAFTGFDSGPSTAPMWPQGDPANLDPAA